MRIVIGIEEGRRLVTARKPLDETEVPEELRGRDRALFGPGLSVDQTVDRIIQAVRNEGDAALRRFNKGLDHADTPVIEVTREEVERAYDAVPADLVDALKLSASRIRLYHERQKNHVWRDFEEDGMGMLVRPLQRVGVYMPGTAIVYPSSVLMTAIPAQVAGVPEIYLVSPAAEDGGIAPVKLVAADIAGVKAIYRAGGAHAVAALAFGTESVQRVDKICGPGNIWVTLAKRKVYGVTGIDNLFGPTETVVVADDSASPVFCAADLIAQAEHDEIASPILLTTSRKLAEAVSEEIEEQLRTLPRGNVARAAIESRGAVVLDSIEQAIELANEFAPEHLCLLTRNARSLLPLIQNAGGVFIGDGTPEAIGDYTAGPSHVMPTGGSARYASPLNVADFLKIMSLVELPPSVVAEIGPAAARIGYAEGLAGHARAVERRLEAM